MAFMAVNVVGSITPAHSVAAFANPLVYAQDYPTKPIHIIVPLPPGGSNDVLARLLGQKMSEGFGQPVIVENKPGAAGNIATDYPPSRRPTGPRWRLKAQTGCPSR